MTHPSKGATSLAKYVKIISAPARLIEISDSNNWLPGDVLVYGPSFTSGRKAGHVNLYVGPFSGTDRTGKT